MKYPLFFFTLLIALFPAFETKAQMDSLVFAEALKHWGKLPDRARIDSLKTIAQSYIGEHEDSLAFARLLQEAIDFGQASGDKSWQIGGLLGFTHVEYRNQQYAYSIQYATKAIALLESNPAMADLYLYAINIKATSYSKLNDTQKAITCFKQAINWVHLHRLEEKVPQELGRIYYNLSNHLYGTDDLISALKYGLLAKKYIDIGGSLRGQALARILIGTIQKSFSNEAEWGNNIREAGNFFLQLNTPLDSLQGLTRLVEVTDEPTQAAALLHTAREIVNSFGATPPPLVIQTYCILLVLISETFDRPDLQERRKAALTELLSYHTDQNTIDEVALRARINLADYYLQAGEFAKAKNLAGRCVEEAQRFGSENRELAARRILARSHAALGDYRAAFLNQAQVEEIQHHLEQKGAPNVLVQTYLSYQFEQEKEFLALQQAHEQQASEAQIARQRLLLWVGGLGLLLLGGLAFAFYRNFRIKQRAAEALAAEQDKLRRSNAKLRRFSGVVSHDILSNLDLILSTGNVLVGSQPKKENLSQYYSFSQRTSRQLKDYCLGLLEEARRMPEEEAPALSDPMPVTHQVLASFGPALRATNFQVELGELSPTALPAALVEQLFQNLVSNAIRHAVAGPAPLLRIAEESDRLGRNLWVVEDNGPGVPEAKREMIFNPQVKEDDSVGQHIGLSLLRAGLREWGMDIWVEDRQGGGARWVVTQGA